MNILKCLPMYGYRPTLGSTNTPLFVYLVIYHQVHTAQNAGTTIHRYSLHYCGGVSIDQNMWHRWTHLRNSNVWIDIQNITPLPGTNI